ncbi:MAG: hypothetical protein IT208_11365 [Chthonomonadales bacterium]|nr:hypothetical protein [Chthonomonadales bacterium]
MLVGARDYDAQAGRFVTRDTLLGEHPYLYCEHEPVGSVDPSGHNRLTEWIGNTLGLDLNFDNDDWIEIENGIEGIADFEIWVGGMGNAGSIFVSPGKPGQSVRPFPPRKYPCPHLPGAKWWQNAPFASSIRVVFGGLTLGGLAAKGLVRGMRRYD